MKIFDFGGAIVRVGFVKGVGGKLLRTKMIYKAGGDNGKGRKLLVEVCEGVKEPGAVASPGYEEGEIMMGKVLKVNGVLVGVSHSAHYAVGSGALGGYLGRNRGGRRKVGLGEIKLPFAIAVLGSKRRGIGVIGLERVA